MIILPNGVAAIEGDTHHRVWVEQEGLIHDLFTANIIRKVFAKYRVTQAIDAGANIGTLTRVMLNAGARVFAFECNPAAVECLRHNCPEASVYECALSDKAGKIAFVPLDNAGASFTVGVLPAKGNNCIQVQAMTLDQLCIKPGFIKLDIEGFETRALMGAQNMIARHSPVILCEFNKGALDRAGSSVEELRKLLQRLGYNRQEIIQPDCKWGDPQFDVLCTPNG